MNDEVKEVPLVLKVIFAMLVLAAPVYIGTAVPLLGGSLWASAFGVTLFIGLVGKIPPMITKKKERDKRHGLVIFSIILGIGVGFVHF